MALLDDYQSSSETADENSDAADPNAARKKRSELELQIVILNSDLGKILREIEAFEMQKRKFKKEEERIRVDRDELDKKLKRLDNDRMSLDDQIRGLKKKLKVLQ